MFGLFKIDAPDETALEAKVKYLEERLAKVEALTEPIRVGDFQMPAYWHSGYRDPRPTVSQGSAIQMILSHLKLSLKAEPAIPERVILEKSK